MKSDLPTLTKLSHTVAMLSADAVQQANSGHPGLPMGAALYTSLVYSEYLRFNPRDPKWANRDRFVLSAGHGSMLLYSMLHLFGFDLPIEQIKNFRQWESRTPGHPEFHITEGVEATTGPLGQGFGNGVGMALSGKLLAAEYSEELFDYKVFGLVSDGDIMEGIAAEAASLAGHLGLNNLIYIYDDNKICLAGETKVCFTESVPQRFEAYGWHVQTVDAYDVPAFIACIEKAIAEPDRPNLICAQSIIGFGSPKKANSFEAHGAPLGDDELNATKQKIGWPLEPRFLIPPEVKSFCESRLAEKTAAYDQWQQRFTEWAKANPEKAKAFEAQMRREVPAPLKDELAKGLSHTKHEATRSLSGKAIQAIAKHVPYFVGGSADLEPSTKTLIKDSAEIQAKHFRGRNIRFGVREHAMGAAVNGFAYGQCWFPYSATFLVFSDYMRPSIRLAALSRIQSLFIFTHDSFWVGEDGPTHEPIEHIASLRLIPDLYVFRPADGLEVGMSYYAALTAKEHPSALLFTRQDLPPLTRREGFHADEILKGGYVLESSPQDTVVLVATGSEVWVAVAAAKLLREQGTHCRIVSMPCVELFLEQPKAFRDSVVPSGMKRVTIEAGVTTGWSSYLGGEVLTIGIDHYGASAPGEVLAEKFGFSPSGVASKIREWL